MYKLKDITSRVTHDGHIVMVAYYLGEAITRTYIGFKTQAEAERMFIDYLNR